MENVCLEVFLKSRGTCLLEHINLGACRPEDLEGAFTAGMYWEGREEGDQMLIKDNFYSQPFKQSYLSICIIFMDR